MERKWPGGGRWFSYILVTFLTAFGDFMVLWGHAGEIRGLQLQPLHLIMLAPVLGLLGAAGDMVWPWVCYKQGMIDSAHPPTPLSGEVDLYSSPYSTVPDTRAVLGHLLVFVRLMNMMLVGPLMEALFFQGFVFAQVQSVLQHPTLSCLVTGGLWSTHKMNYHGEILLRLVFGVSVCFLASRLPDQSLLFFFLSLASRNLVAFIRAVIRRKWYMWVV